VIRTAALSLAAALSAAIPLYDIADNVLSLVENKPPYREYPLKVASVSLLGLLKQLRSKKVALTESHKRLLRAYVVRLASCAADEFKVEGNHNRTANSSNGYVEDDKSIAHAAMDLLSLASLVVSELDGSSGKDFAAVLATPLPALRALKGCVDTLQMNNFEIENGVEREVCRRMRALDFPSLAEETTYTVAKPLVVAIRPQASKSSDKALNMDALALGKVRAEPSDGESTPRIITPRKPAGSGPAVRRNSSLRKSWNGAVESPRKWDDAAEQALLTTASAKFSPPKLVAGQAHSFHGSPVIAGGGGGGAPLRSSSQRGNDAFYQPSWSASSVGSEGSADLGSAVSSSTRGGKAHEAGSNGARLPELDSTGEASFHSSLQSRASSIRSGLTNSSASDSFHTLREVGRSSDLELESVDISRASSVEEGQQTAKEYMGRSLRLLKSPHSRQRSEGSAPAPYSPMRPAAAVRGYSADYDGVVQSSEWLHGGRSTADSDAESTGRPPNTFDSASKARLKRSRLRSANTNLLNAEEGVPVEADALNDSFHTPSKGDPRSSHHQRTPNSSSGTAMERHLGTPYDERPLGGAGRRQNGYFDSNEDLEALGAYEANASAAQATSDNAIPTPARKPGRRSKLSAPTADEPSAPLKLNEVTSLITKPDTTYDYVASEDLKPLNAPTQELNKALKGLEVQEWPEIFHTLNTFRRAALHHPALLLNSSNLHNTLVLIIKRVDDLRSSLAKNGLLTVEDMINGLRKALDMEVATFLPVILKVMQTYCSVEWSVVTVFVLDWIVAAEHR
jgi:hypothetical protein